MPLGPQQPVQAQFTQTMSAGDLHFNGFDYSPGRAGEQLVSLPNGTTPTYKACSTATTFTSSVADTQGASFCILEEDGDFAGVYVAADQSGYAQLQASVWQGAPPVG